MTTNDLAYFSRRAEEERKRAGIAEDGSAAFIHLRLAEEYEKRVNALASAPDANASFNVTPAGR